MTKTCDFAVIGAGVFGAWAAHCLRQNSATVALVEAYGPARRRASSGGETRVVRMGYGPDELYMRWSMRSLLLWREFFSQTGDDLFHPTGVLWISNDDDLYTRQMFDLVSKAGISCEALSAEDIRRRWPQLAFSDCTWGVLEAESGVLMARRSVQALVNETIKSGTEYLTGAVLPPPGGTTL